MNRRHLQQFDMVFFNSEILQHHLNGIQFALGDLEVDTTSLPMP